MGLVRMAYNYTAAASYRTQNGIHPRSGANVTNIASVVTIVTGILAVLIALAGLRLWQRCVQRKVAPIDQSTLQEPVLDTTNSEDETEPHPPTPTSTPNTLQHLPRQATNHDPIIKPSEIRVEMQDDKRGLQEEDLAEQDGPSNATISIPKRCLTWPWQREPK